MTGTCGRCAALEAQVAELTAQLDRVESARKERNRKNHLRHVSTPEEKEQTRRRNARRRARANAAALPAAVNNRKPWTGPELELASRTDLTARDVAAKLGRTFYAVRTMRERLEGARAQQDGRWRQLRDGPLPPASMSGG